MAAPVLAYENLGLVQGSGWLFRGLDLFIGPRDRLALIGRNGAGKTTLLKCLAGLIETDEGGGRSSPGPRSCCSSRIRRSTDFATLRDFALAAPTRRRARGRGDRRPARDRPRPARRHRLGRRAAPRRDRPRAGAGSRRAAARRADQPSRSRRDRMARGLARPLHRRLHRDQPRPHLPEAADPLDAVARPRQLRRAEIGFGGFEAWTEQVYAEEARAAEKLDAKLKLELHWLQRGVTARRKRNQGRLAKLHEMRAARAAMLGPAGTREARPRNDDVKTKMVIDADKVTKRFGERADHQDFTLRIQRGDRIGVVGANGTGKTTLLKLLTGELEPDEGKVTRAKTLTGS
jgi:ATP-binding cassette subfamily F protein uup